MAASEAQSAQPAQLVHEHLRGFQLIAQNGRHGPAGAAGVAVGAIVGVVVGATDGAVVGATVGACVQPDMQLT